MSPLPHLSRRHFLQTSLAAASALLLPKGSLGEEDATTAILKWHEGKKAAFTMGFDDDAPSQLKNVLPELERRKLVGTFYLVTGNKLWEGSKNKWIAAAESPYFMEANHTFTHKGATTQAELEVELQKCNEVLLASFQKQRKNPRLIAWGKPGGVPFTVPKEELAASLAKFNLVSRPAFSGPPINYKSAVECTAMIDKTLAKGEMGQMVFHGVGGDWLTTPLDWFAAILDKLEAVRSEMWVTDFISAHKYSIERKTAVAKTTQNTAAEIRVELKSEADPAFYDQALTLASRVPAAWTNCLVTQGATRTKVAAANGLLTYPAVPGGDVIQITPERA